MVLCCNGLLPGAPPISALCCVMQCSHAGRADTQVNTADVSGTSNRQGNLQQQHPTLAAMVATEDMPGTTTCIPCKQLAWQQFEQMTSDTASKVREPLSSSLPHCLTPVCWWRWMSDVAVLVVDDTNLVAKVRHYQPPWILEPATFFHLEWVSYAPCRYPADCLGHSHWELLRSPLRQH